MKKKLISVLLVGVLAVSMSAGCGQKEDAKKDTKVSSEKKEKKEKKPEYKTIGTKEDEAYEVQLTNSTGQDITFVSFKSSSEENYPDTMLDEGDSFKNEETRNVYYKPSEEAAASTETEDGKELPAIQPVDSRPRANHRHRLRLRPVMLYAVSAFRGPGNPGY